MILADAAEPTRKVFEHFDEWMKISFYVLAFLMTNVFLVGAAIRIRKYRKGRKAGRLDRPMVRIGRALHRAGSNTTVAKRNISTGIAHAAILWGFVTLFIGTVILTIDYDVIRLAFGENARFFKGGFYLGYSMILDTLGAAYIAGLLFIAYRRRVRRPAALDYTRVDKAPGEYSRAPYRRGDWLFWHFLFWLGVGGFLLEGLRIYAHGFPAHEIWSPVGWLFARGIRATGMSATTAADAQLYAWWGHGAMALLFIGYIPYSKAMHMLTDAANLAFTDGSDTSMALPRVPAGAQPGYRHLADFTWKELLDFDACTKCGRCHEVCPARTAGAPLSPRDLILDLRQFAEQASGVRPVMDWEHRPAGNGIATTVVAGGVIPAETLWACTTCMACVEACPVGIEHVPTIVQMRRALVDAGTMDATLQDALQNIAKTGNSFGQSPKARARWTKELDFEIPDARKHWVQVLWFVGDYASFDQRLQELARTFARLLRRAGVSFGILYEGERNAGNDVRRVGEEGLFEELVEHNVTVLQGCDFAEIVTTDPHSFNTLKNEYPQFGGTYKVSHYTSLLLRLLEQEALVPRRDVDMRVTFHDPCYLARYNKVTKAPREILRHLGIELVEMPRNRENTFCCGAGGGRIWMDDSNQKERPSENRIKEAVALGVDSFVVACPKDVTMYRDAAKTTGFDDRLRVLDIVELVERAVESPEERAALVPAAAQEPA
ncbi:MAG: (Fe-S)-binding protein [Actinomycetota bacterium]